MEFSFCPQKSTQAFREVHSTPSDLHVPIHPTPLSSTRITTSSGQDIHTTRSTTVQSHSHKQHEWTSYSNLKPNAKRLPAASGSYNTAKQVYDMGVRWTPHSFPSFVVSSTNAFSKSKPPRESGRKMQNTSSLANNSSSKSAGKNATGTRHQNGKKQVRQARKHSMEQPTITTKTISPFPLITHTSEPTNPPTGMIPPITLQNQGLLATRREFSHLLRRKRSVSFHNGRPSFHYESLCLEGHGATVTTVSTPPNGCKDDVVAPNTTTDVALDSGGNLPVRIPGPWM